MQKLRSQFEKPTSTSMGVIGSMLGYICGIYFLPQTSLIRFKVIFSPSTIPTPMDFIFHHFLYEVLGASIGAGGGAVIGYFWARRN